MITCMFVVPQPSKEGTWPGVGANLVPKKKEFERHYKYFLMESDSKIPAGHDINAFWLAKEKQLL